jgi:peptide/nickel transport system permease protein
MSRLRRFAPLLLPGALILLAAGAAALAPLLPLPDPTRIDVPNRFAGSSWAHPLGQDEFGRDVLSRIVWGARASLSVAVGAALLAAAAGAALGLVGAWFRGAVEFLTVRASEVVLCLPPLLLALLVVTLLGPGAGTLVVALAILFTPPFVRVAYSAALQVKGLDYVTAQTALGIHPARILVRTVLLNIAPPLLVQLSLTVASAMMLESGLSFLGLGVVPPEPSWGLMIRGARGAMAQAPMLLVWPCLALTLMILAFNAFCDRLRDVLDPRGEVRGGAALFGSPAAPRAAAAAPADDALLTVRGLRLTLGGAVPLVRDASFTVRRGETLALVGESGSGKTLSSLAVMGLSPPGVAPTAGSAVFAGAGRAPIDLTAAADATLRPLRGAEIAMIFQDPGASLNPVRRIGDQIAEALRVHGGGGDLRAQVVALLARVGIPDPRTRIDAYPHELSGGQRQRAMIAMAVANRPRLLIADEPTTALDPTIQAQILDLLRELKADDPDRGMIFVTHNLAVVSEIADSVCVMYAGETVETGPVAQVFAAPRHPYTAALLASAPEASEGRLVAIPGVVPRPEQLPVGCRFAPRCPHAQAPCRAATPPLAETGEGRATRCLRWREVA